MELEMEVVKLMMMTNEMAKAIPMEMEFVIAIETELGALLTLHPAGFLSWRTLTRPSAW